MDKTSSFFLCLYESYVSYTKDTDKDNEKDKENDNDIDKDIDKDKERFSLLWRIYLSTEKLWKSSGKLRSYPHLFVSSYKYA